MAPPWRLTSREGQASADMTTNNNENKNTTITVLDTTQAFRELLTAPAGEIERMLTG
mgnify:CR=1 FL=1